MYHSSLSESWKKSEAKFTQNVPLIAAHKHADFGSRVICVKNLACNFLRKIYKICGNAGFIPNPWDAQS